MASNNKEILNKRHIKEAIMKLLYQLQETIDAWDDNHAYWQLQHIIHIDFKIREYKPLSASSYIPTPKEIDNTKSVMNIKNDDQKCFKYCLMYAKYKDEIFSIIFEYFQKLTLFDTSFNNYSIALL
jgi:hypothetical protein